MYILTKANSSLLTIKDFKSTILIFYPVHNIQRKPLHNSINNSISLFIFINKFTLILWSYIQSTVISNNAIFLIICVVFSYFPYCQFMQFNFHLLFSLSAN